VAGWCQVPEFLMCCLIVFSSYQFPCVNWSLQINTCNGFYCDYFTPNKKYKPTMWTEAWTGWYFSWSKSRQKSCRSRENFSIF
jgi:hypothetical protein